MQVDAFAIRLRRRGSMEAADLGVRLAQSSARQLYCCYLLAIVPVLAIALASFRIADWLPTFLIWMAKPWVDRTALFVLSRAAFGQQTTVADLWHAQRQVWWSQLLSTFTLRRLSPWRSFTAPVYQLEGHALRDRGKRVRQIRLGNTGSAVLMTSAFSCAELALSMAVVSLIFWFAPTGQAPELRELFTDEGTQQLLELLYAVGYGVVVIFLEPLYVAAGFGMYLNRRVELEAWDIEQEFRRAFA